jgi:hypothetical protein
MSAAETRAGVGPTQMSRIQQCNQTMSISVALNREFRVLNLNFTYTKNALDVYQLPLLRHSHNLLNNSSPIREARTASRQYNCVIKRPHDLQMKKITIFFCL